MAVTTLDGRLPAGVRLPNGTILMIRELHATDEPALRAWFATLSPSTRYHRFHGLVAELSAPDWRYLTRIDQRDHVAILALRDGGAIAGVARMIRLSGEHDIAEVTFLVDDDLQQRRVGTVLRDVLIAIARRRGYRRLYAYVLPDNVAIRRLLGKTSIDRGGLLEIAI